MRAPRNGLQTAPISDLATPCMAAKSPMPAGLAGSLEPAVSDKLLQSSREAEILI
jgi:hypothetical protein